MFVVVHSLNLHCALACCYQSNMVSFPNVRGLLTGKQITNICRVIGMGHDLQSLLDFSGRRFGKDLFEKVFFPV